MTDKMDLSLLDKFFHITLTGAEDAVYSVPAAELLKQETMDDLIRRSTVLLKGLDTSIAASFVGLSFFNLCASVQLMLGSYNRLIDLTLDNLTFQIQPHHDHIHACFTINELRWKEAPAVNREEWLLEELTAYFQANINPVIACAAAAAGVKPDLMWNQYGARMAYALDYVRARETREEIRDRFQRDYESLSRSLPSEAFGRRRNPFAHKPVYLDSPYKPGDQIMMRSSCCMWDRREGGQKCFNCPRMLPGEREERRAEIAKAAQG